MMVNRKLLPVVVLLTACATFPPRTPSGNESVPVADIPVPINRADYEATGHAYGIAAQGRAASEAADRMLREGGNIIDAAVAASFAISVERPHSTGIGGGGFLLFRDGKTGKVYAADFRERAPLRAHRDMYLDASGAFQPEKSMNGILSVATPGLIAGLEEIHRRWGKLPFARTVQPAIELAEKGFPVYPTLSSAISMRASVLAADPESRKLFLRADGSPLKAGDLLVQKDLAETLRQIAKHGKAGFYQGRVGQAMLDFFKKEGGLIEKKDFDAYQVKWRTPVEGSFRGSKIYSMPPPSSGGLHVLQILNMLENDPLQEIGALSDQAIHRVASATQLAFADRAVYPGDPDFVKVPMATLTSKDYAKKRRALIDENRAKPSSEVKAGTFEDSGHTETTHFSIMDKDGNAVASTQTINVYFGSGVVVPGTGILLNDEMDDFSGKAGSANAFGAIGGEANSIAPGKRPLSSMSPTIVVRDGKAVMTVGAPGGTRIITCVAQTLLNYLGFGLPAWESVAAVRFHHQWQPDEIQMDAPGAAPDVMRSLESLGHRVRVAPNAVSCRTQLVTREGDTMRAVADPRDWGYSIAR